MPLHELFRTCFVVAILAQPVLANEVTTIATGTGRHSPKQPQVTVAGEGTVHLVYGMNDAVFHTQSVDDGKSFNSPLMAFECPNMSLGMRRGPRLAMSGSTIVVTAIGGVQGKGRAGDLLAWQRLPSGEWKGPNRVNDVADAAREGLHAMASGPDGTVWCCWLDLRNKKTEIVVAKSTDAGATWSANQLVYRSPSGSVCECCHPSLAVGFDGHVHVMFRNSIDGNRDLYLVSGTNGQFGQAIKLGEGTWPLKACPMDGGSLAVDAQGTVAAVWRRKGEVFLGTTGPERLLGQGEQPSVACTASGPKSVWVEKVDARLFLAIPGNTPVATLAQHARDPVIVPLRDGEKCFACWESVTGLERSIVGLVIP